MKEEADGDRLVQALHGIRRGDVALQEKVLSACEGIIRADGVITEREVQVIRTLAGAMGIPVPLSV